MQEALQQIDAIIAVLLFENIQIQPPETTLYKFIVTHLDTSQCSFITLNQLHFLTQKSFIKPTHTIHNKDDMCIMQMLHNLSGIDGMNINLPWKIRDKTFNDFVHSVAGLIIDGDKISIDYRINIQPYLNTICQLPLTKIIGYLLSNNIRKNARYKYMKQDVKIYKKSFEITKLLQNIHFDMSCLQNDDTTSTWNRLFIQTLNASHSINMYSIFKQIQKINNHNNNKYQIVSALELLSHFQCQQKHILKDLDLSFYQKQQQDEASLNNIIWSEIPEIIQPKWMINQSKKSIKNNEKAIKWKQQQIESFYEILKLYFLSKCDNNSSLTIVDFGCGAGNVTLCLAYLLPMDSFICIECKTSRIELARQRAEQCGIKNIKFVCKFIENINNDDIDTFDIGIAIHACGYLTDYAQIECIKHNASFILCSCCNGKCCNIQTNNYMIFPRSNYLRNIVSFNTFKILTSFSDFNFDIKRNNDYDYYRYNIKRKFCKILCEIDRCLYALEIKDDGYKKVILTQIYSNNKIFESSPKSDIIIGIHSDFFQVNKCIW